jgi:hypothetical protein
MVSPGLKNLTPPILLLRRKRRPLCQEGCRVGLKWTWVRFKGFTAGLGGLSPIGLSDRGDAGLALKELGSGH